MVEVTRNEKYYCFVKTKILIQTWGLNN